MANALADRFPRNLASARKAAGLTQTALARMAGLSPGYVSMLENGQRVPTLDVIDALAGALNMTDGAALLASHGE